MKIAITGGLSCGKSKVAEILKKKKYTVLNADDIYKELLKSSSILKEKIIRLFGKDILRQGVISQKLLRQKVFSKKGYLEKISQITHPFIISSLKKKLRLYGYKKKTIFVEIPLLFELNLEKLFDRVVVISSSKKLIFSRAKRKGYTLKMIKTIINQQMDLKDKEKRGDYVIRNNYSLFVLRKNIDLMLEDLM